MVLGKVFERFTKKSPVTVMMRGILEFALPEERIDALFRRHARRQYERELLFSSVVNLLSLVVCSVRKSVNAAYQATKDEFQVSVQSLYHKLSKSEPEVTRALVRESAERLRPAIAALKPARPPLLRGWRVLILDGNHLTGTEHRLKETRLLHSSPLPGQALVVLDPASMLMVDLFPCEDAHAQERSLLPEVLKSVQPGDLYIADRNFCTTQFLFGLVARGADFVIRQHASTLQGKELLGTRKRIGRTDRGVVYEQKLRINNEQGAELTLRRVTIELDEPTEDGETEIHLLTTLPARINALRVAALYLQRWTIENAFQELEQSLESEIDTLCYPGAALLAFGVAVLTYNMLSTMKAALRSAHGEDAAVHKLSGYYLAEEIRAIYGGMMVAIPPGTWTKTFGSLTPRQLASVLKNIASHVVVGRFHKTTRGPKKPPPPRTGGLREKHVSTARLLATRSKQEVETG
jgi:IS4 transposase